jgi:hypothetical protein
MSVKSKITGHSLSEYSLIVGLTVIVAIGGLSVLGLQVSDLLGNTITKSSGPKNVIATGNPNGAKILGPGVGGFFLSPQQIDTILNQSPTQTLDLGNGKKLTIPNPNLNALSETLGPNGSTEVGLALLKRLQEALIAQGIDPNSIPEMAFFANAAHKTSDIQKQSEMFLKDLYGGVGANGLSSGNEYIASLDNGSVGIVKFSDYEFSKDAQGNYLVKNYVDSTGNLNYDFTPLKELPVQEQMNLSAVMTQRKLLSVPGLAAIKPTFDTIWKNINTGTNNLAIGIDTRINYTGPVDSVAPPLWLNTKIEANKACILSKESNCIQ